MAYKDLRDWIERLEEEGELRRIAAEVDPVLEIAAITDRVSKEIGPALLFENVKGSEIPLLINQFGSERRMKLALETDSLDAIGDRIERLIDQDTPSTLWEKVGKIPEMAHLARILPKAVSSGLCREVVKRGDEATLAGLPIITAWPEDAGPFITLGAVFSRHPETGRRNAGIYRMQVHDDKTTGMHVHVHHDAAENLSRLGEGERLPMAVALGTDPSVTFAAAAPCPPGVDEMLLAGFIRGGGVEMTPCVSVPIEVPASSEIVLEGWVDPSELRREGPFGDHTGFYSLPEDFPTFKISAVTHRRDPIYATTIVGPPPMEDCWMGYAIERIFLPMIRKILPEVVDLHMPFEGVFHNLVLVSIKKRYPGQARKVMHGLWGLGQLVFSKVIVVVDEDVDVKNPSEVAWRAMANMDPRHDIEFSTGPAETLDHASRRALYGSKVGVDATRKLPSEGFSRPWPGIQRHPAEILERISSRWKEYGF